MRILFIAEYFPATSNLDVHGGVEIRTFHVAKHLAKNHTVLVVTSKEEQKPQSQEINRINIQRVGLRRKYVASNGQFFSRFIFIIQAFWRGLSLDFDVVEGTGITGWLPAYGLGLVKHKKRILFFPDLVESYGAGSQTVIGKVLFLFQKWILKERWHQIICISHTVSKKLLSLGVPKKNISIIYCSTDSAQIKRISVKKRVFPTLSCVSRLVPYKRVNDLIEAMVFIKKKFPSVKLEIIGVGDQLNKLQKLTSYLHLNSQIKFHKYIKNHSDVLKLVKSSHVFTLPSVTEGFGIVTLEALAAGVPVVVPDLPIYHEVTRNKAALFFIPKKSQDLAKYVIKLLSSKSVYKQLVYEAREVVGNYSIKKMVYETERVYERVCVN